ncbi:MAG: NFACT RNA binding domain-containing protein [Candidatus Aenigmatarchaeota archaeon]
MPIKKLPKNWHTKFRNFATSDGYVVVIAANAAEKEKLVTKCAEENDLIIRSESANEPFIMLKTNNQLSETALKEAVEFAAANCCDWHDKLENADVYCVKPAQLSKTIPSGELLAKGYFFVNGEKKFFNKIDVKLSIGVKMDGSGNALLITGPVMATRKNSDYFLTLLPGTNAAETMVEEIKRRILLKALPEHKNSIEKITVEEISSHLPTGTMKIAE